MKLSNVLSYYRPEGVQLDEAAKGRILAGAMEQIHQTQGKKSRKRPWKVGLLTAALVAVLSITAAAVIQYSRSTQLMQEEWNTAANTVWKTTASEAMSPEQSAYLEGRTVTIGQSATDQGLTITMESMTVSNHSITFGLSYRVENEKKFPYSLEVYGVIPKSWDYSWMNPAYGTVQGQRSTVTEQGMLELNTWTSLPDDQIICDGSTEIEIEFQAVYIISGHVDDVGLAEKIAAIDGSWQFKVSVPKMTQEAEYTVESQQLEAAMGNSNVSILVTSTGCSLVLPEAYVLTDPADAVGEKEVAVEFCLKNGDAVPDFGSVGWNHDGITEYVIPWVALDPTELAELRIYRGGTTQNLPLIEKSPG